jgi:hypothetical protein
MIVISHDKGVIGNKKRTNVPKQDTPGQFVIPEVTLFLDKSGCDL